jgi:hypothetical protein
MPRHTRVDMIHNNNCCLAVGFCARLPRKSGKHNFFDSLSTKRYLARRSHRDMLRKQDYVSFNAMLSPTTAYVQQRQTTPMLSVRTFASRKTDQLNISTSKPNGGRVRLAHRQALHHLFKQFDNFRRSPLALSDSERLLALLRLGYDSIRCARHE